MARGCQAASFCIAITSGLAVFTFFEKISRGDAEGAKGAKGIRGKLDIFT